MSTDPMSRPAPSARSASSSVTRGRHALVIYDNLSKTQPRPLRNLAAAAPSAGPQSLPRRRLLPALAYFDAREASANGGGSAERRLPIIEKHRPVTSRPTSRQTSSRSRTPEIFPRERYCFRQGVRPPSDGQQAISVSRVGGSAQMRWAVGARHAAPRPGTARSSQRCAPVRQRPRRAAQHSGRSIAVRAWSIPQAGPVLTTAVGAAGGQCTPAPTATSTPSPAGDVSKLPDQGSPPSWRPSARASCSEIAKKKTLDDALKAEMNDALAELREGSRRSKGDGLTGANQTPCPLNRHPAPRPRGRVEHSRSPRP